MEHLGQFGIKEIQNAIGQAARDQAEHHSFHNKGIRTKALVAPTDFMMEISDGGYIRSV